MNEKQKAVNNIDKTVMHEITYYKEWDNNRLFIYAEKHLVEVI